MFNYYIISTCTEFYQFQPDVHREKLMTSMKRIFTKFSLMLTNNKGQGLVEYALILVLIAIVVFAGLQLFGIKLNNTYETIDTGVTNAGFK
jgi:pilus assembly protein Flp/PilA